MRNSIVLAVIAVLALTAAQQRAFLQQPAAAQNPANAAPPANPRQQPGAMVTMFAPDQHDLYDGHFVVSANRVYMVGTLNDPVGWNHMDNDAKTVKPVPGTVEIDVNEIKNTGKFEARLKVPEGDLVLAIDRFNEFSPCQNGGIVAVLHEHGTDSGCGDNNWPKTFVYLAGWGFGHATLNGKPLYDNYEMHFMVTQGIRDRKTLKVNYPLASKQKPGGEVNPATQQLDFYIRSPLMNPRNTPGREVFAHFFAMEVTWKIRDMLIRLAPLTLVVLSTTVFAGQGTGGSDPVARLGHYVETYYARAQSVVTEETVVIQPLGMDLTGVGFPRRATYELRVEWDPTAATADERAVAVRQLIKATGPALFDPGEEECGDPPSITPEPLAFLLPDNQAEWNFVMGRPDRVDGRTAMTIEYRRRDSRPPQVIVDKDCLFTDLSGQIAGRLWADSSTDEILRIDERLIGIVDVKIPKALQKKGRPSAVTYERVTSSVRYKRIRFTDPDEELLLPASIEALTVHRSNTGVSRLRITQTFAKYRRFVTGSRLLD